jgi:hypothetical protein
MLARRLTIILPAMTLAEAIETTRIHRVAGLSGDRTALVRARPFRAQSYHLGCQADRWGPQPAVIARGPSSSSWPRPSSSHGRPRVLRSLAIRSRPVDHMP